MIISKPLRYFPVHTSIYIKDGFHVILHLNTILFLKSQEKNNDSWILVFMQSTVILLVQKCTETYIHLAISLKDKREGLIPNRSTWGKTLIVSSGTAAAALWEIREDSGSLPTQLQAHLRSTYIHLAIQLGLCCCARFQSHMILVLLCNVQPFPHASLTKRRRKAPHNPEASKSTSSLIWSDVHYSYGKSKVNLNLSKCTI